MASDGRHPNYIRRIQKVCEIVNEHYEEGNHARCYKAVWKKYVNPVYPMSYRTLLKYVSTPVPKPSEPTDKNQLKLFDDV